MNGSDRESISIAHPASRTSLQTWGLPLLVFLIAFIPRSLSLSTFLTADEDDQLRFSTEFLEAVSRRDWAGALVVGYPGVPTMGLGALGIWVESNISDLWGNTNTTSNRNTTPPNKSPVGAPNVASSVLQKDLSNKIYLPMMAQVRPPPALSERVSAHPLNYITAVRLPLVTTAAIVLTVIFLGLRQLIGDRLAFVALLFLAFDPFIMAHSRVIHVDAPLAYFMFAAFVAFIVYLQRGGWPWLVISGILGALGVLSKTPGIILAPILLVSGLIYIWLSAEGEDRQMRLRRLVTALVIWAVIAVVAFFALWPSMWGRPLYAVSRIVENVFSVLAFESHPTSGVFWGLTRADRSPFYYLITIPFHLTPLSTVGLFAGVGLAVIGIIHRRRGIKSIAVTYLPLLLSLLAYGTLFIVPVSMVGRRADRYILPVYFAFDVLAAVGLWAMITVMQQRWAARQTQKPMIGQSTVSFGFALLAVLIQMLFVLWHHPYYLTYFNPLFGGARTAPYLINVGWGEGLDQAAEYLNQKSNVADTTVAAWYSWQFANYFNGHSIDLASNEPAYTADYTVFYINQIQRGFPSRELLDYFEDRQPDKVITVRGMDYAWIYKGPIIDTVLPRDVMRRPNTPFGQAVTLAGFDFPQFSPSGDTVPISLYWHVAQPLPADMNVSLRVVDSAGRTWGQVDRFPIGGLIRTSAWQPGMVIRDDYLLTLEPGTPPGDYHLDLLMYNFETNQIFDQASNVDKIAILPPAPIDDVTAVAAVLPNGVSAPLSPDVILAGHDWSPSDIWPGRRYSVRLTWYASANGLESHDVSLIAQGESEQEVVLVNKPIGPETYPIRQWRRGQVVADVVDFAIPVDTAPGDYTLIARAGGFNDVPLGQLTVVEPARIFSLPDTVMDQMIPYVASLGNDIHLSGYQYHVEGDLLNLTFYWSATNTPNEDYKVFVHLSDTAGNIITQKDGVPVDGQRPTTTWLPDELIVDTYQLPLPEDQYERIWLGMYNPITSDRLTALSPRGLASENRIQIPIPQDETP